MRKLIVTGVLAIIAIAVSCSYTPKNQGQALYEEHCQSCHMEEGQGLGELIPPIKGADWVLQDPALIGCVIKNGMEGPVVVNGTTYNKPMPGNKLLSEVDLANLVNYVRELNGLGQITLPELKRQMGDCGG